MSTPDKREGEFMSSIDYGLKGKVAIVTGASKGIGYSIAEALARAGVKTLLISRNEAALSMAVEKIHEMGGEAAMLVGDVADPLMPSRALAQANQLWGSVDIFINNAGGPPMGAFMEHSDEVWLDMLQTNLLAGIRFARALVPDMQKNEWGRIVSISSTVAKEPTPTMVLSATARAGLSAFTKAISTELAEYNITANVICPGGVLTDRLESLFKTKAQRESANYDNVLQEAQNSIPAKRFANPSEIADVALFLASELGSYVTGVSLPVDGGLTKGYF